MTKKKHILENKVMIIVMSVAIVILGIALAWSYLAHAREIHSTEQLNKALSRPIIRDSYSNLEKAHDSLDAIDTDLPGLVAALDAGEDQQQCGIYEGRYKIDVLRVNQNKDQALIARWCGSTGMRRSLIIKHQQIWMDTAGQKDMWKNSPNYDLTTDTPACQLVDQYNIDIHLAPVCFEGEDDQTSYRIR